MATTVFLAHAHEDEEQVGKLHAALKARGFDPWLDKVDLIPGQNWEIEIPKAIRQSDVFLACLSRQSVEKYGYVQKEFRLALSTAGERPPGSIYVIPVRLDECEVPDLQDPQIGMRLRAFHWVDLWKEGGIDQLTSAIEYRKERRLERDTNDHIATLQEMGNAVAPKYIKKSKAINGIATIVGAIASVVIGAFAGLVTFAVIAGVTELNPDHGVPGAIVSVFLLIGIIIVVGRMWGGLRSYAVLFFMPFILYPFLSYVVAMALSAMQKAN